MMPRRGDLVFFPSPFANKRNDSKLFPPALGIVMDVLDPPNYHSGIDYTIQILEESGKIYTYDIFRGTSGPEVLSSIPNHPD
jgi:hypothetical protein